MKKVLCFVAAISVAIVTMGQEGFINLSKGIESAQTDRDMVLNGRYVGSVDDCDLWVTLSERGTRNFDDKDNWQLVKLNRELEPVGRVELKKTEDMKLLAATMEGNKMSVVFLDQREKRRTVVFKGIVDLDSMYVPSYWLDTVKVMQYGRKDQCFVWSTVSPDGRYVGLVTIVNFKETLQYTAEVKMFDALMNELWSKEYEMGSTQDVHVTNDGSIVTLASERVDGEQKFIFNVVDKKQAETYEVGLKCDPVKEMRIIKVSNNKVLCGGTYQPIESDPDDKMTGGVVALSFSLDTMAVAGFTMRPFQNEDMNILLNKKTKRVQKKQMLPMVDLLATTATPYGGVVALGHRQAMRYTNPNGTAEYSFMTEGIHMVTVDDNAEVQWVRNIRRNDISDEGDDLMYISLFSHDREVCLVKSESPKYPGYYDISDEAPEYEMGDDKGNLVIYRMQEDGEISKTILDKKSKFALASSAIRRDGSIILLMLREKKSRMVELRFE
ncbi:MAG: hypothetical protein ACSW8I_01950 [bacterium]